jgi:8-oxo-dGTP pyrophosphatase MutT (NUDIX family)
VTRTTSSIFASGVAHSISDAADSRIKLRATRCGGVQSVQVIAIGWETVDVSKPRPGYGIRHPDLVAVLQTLTPITSQLANWGELRFRISAYLSEHRVPDPLVTSVRCLVEVDRRIVVTESADDVNVWPGGRREPGETMRQTAVREVHEETGYQLEPKSLQLLGFLHFEHLAPPPDDYPYPHPDFLQLVCRGRASERPSDDWQDIDGYVQRSWLETPSRARQLTLDPVSLPFLDAFQGIAK